ncbi:type I-E CRISPR-associated protein Cas7/Cse4/CasC [Salinibacter altiplanensis]|uniref:type I-E CRISPR-associated protein Cas7/Cse4/CasC n=1 Tax=Salinibacter altiplanensis TaxID=1803181 RepID=UPI000C9F86BB|nr:type I-E CRISPR-associated protein Cas7/Cse4/CasC [Salinibacter altiplanensis]
MSKFLQFHTLTSYPGTLLNRDDAGFAKTLPFGNAKRTRVSSQCLKYHWRHYEGTHAIRNAGDMSIRSRRTFRKKVADELVDDGFDERLTAAVAFGILEMVRNGDVTKGDIKDNVQPVLEAETPLDELVIDNIVVFGKPEIEHLKSVAEDTLGALQEKEYDEDSVAQTRDAIADLLGEKELRNNLRGMGNAMGIDAAMHGRMVTSDVLAQGDAAVHVAHAITTHAQQREDDYFTAVDELHEEGTGGEEAGAALIQSKELTSGLFYSYVVVDVPLLVSNLEGCERGEWEGADLGLTTDVLRRFLHTITNVSPGAKLSSTAPYAKAEFVMVESGEEQPRTLANAFKEAVEGNNLLEESVKELTKYTRKIDEMYGQKIDGETVPHEERICATMAESQVPASRTSVSEIADDWIPTQITNFASA